MRSGQKLGPCWGGQVSWSSCFNSWLYDKNSITLVSTKIMQAIFMQHNYFCLSSQTFYLQIPLKTPADSSIIRFCRGIWNVSSTYCSIAPARREWLMLPILLTHEVRIGHSKVTYLLKYISTYPRDSMSSRRDCSMPRWAFIDAYRAVPDTNKALFRKQHVFKLVLVGRKTN